MRIDIRSFSAQWVADNRGTTRELRISPQYGCGGPLKITALNETLYLPGIFEPQQGLCVTLDGIVPNEAIGDWNLGHMMCRFEGPGPRYENEFETDYCSEEVCVLGNIYSRVFGHWTEEMLKVVILEHAGFEGVYVLSDMPRFAHDFLKLAGVSEARVLDIREPTIFRSAVFPTRVDHDNIDRYGNVLNMLRESLFSRIDAEPGPFGPRIWLDRSAMVENGGVLINRDEIQECLEQYGIVSVDMAGIPVAEQVRAARDMRLACGVHGSQFVHVQFMPAGSSVVECFSPSYVNPSVITICRALSHRYNQIVAVNTPVLPYPHGRDMLLNRDHLDLVLSKMTD